MANEHATVRTRKGKIFVSFCMFYSVIGWGLYIGLLGASLLDIRDLTHTSITQIATMFTAMSASSLLGAPVGGALLDRLDFRIYLFVVLCLHGVGFELIPLCRNYVTLLVVSCLNGFLCGALDTGLNVSALKIWGWGGAAYMQAFHCLFGVGTFVAPFIAEPFITHTDASSDVTENRTSENRTQQTTPSQSIATTCELNTTSFNNNQTTTVTSQILIPYSIVMVYIVTSGVLFLITFCCIRAKNTTASTKSGTMTLRKAHPRQRERWLYRISMDAAMFFRFGLYVGLEVAYASLVMTYAVYGLGWTRRDGLRAASAYRGSFAVSRGVNILLTLVLNPWRMMLLDLALMLTSLAVMAGAVTLHPLVLWVGTCVLGVGMASFYGASMSWVDHYMWVTGKDGAVFLTGSQAGVMAIPALAGYLMDNVHSIWFIYLCLLVVGLLTVVVAIAKLLAWRHGPKSFNMTSSEERNGYEMVAIHERRAFENGT